MSTATKIISVGKQGPAGPQGAQGPAGSAANVTAANVLSAIQGMSATQDAAVREALSIAPGNTPRAFHRLLAVGDSIVAAVGTTAVTWNQHFLTVALALCGGRAALQLSSTGVPCFGASGATTQQIKRAYLDRAALSDAQGVLILAGTNDYPLGRTAAEVAATLGEMVDVLLAAGKTPVVCDVLPLPSGQAAKSAWITGVWAATATMMAARPAAIHVQWASALDTNLDGVADSDSYFSDSVHPDLDGHYRLGIALHAAISSRLETRDPFEGCEWRSPNPTMSGTLGAGNIATGWAVDDGSGKTVTKTLIARSGSLGNWQQLDISGDAAVNTFFRYGFGFNAATGGWAIGEEVEMLMEFETDNNLSALFNASPQLRSTVSGADALRVTGFSGVGGTFTQFQRLPSGVILSPRYVIVANTTTLWPYIPIAGTGTLRLGRVGLRLVRPT